MKGSNTVIGTARLCAWQPAPGVVWVQTRSPEHARRLAQRSDGRRVAFSVAGGFLRIFEFRHSLTWGRNLIARYTLAETTANERKNKLGAPPRARTEGS